MSELIEFLERDRKRIADDLHDFSLQNLTYLSHKIELASMMIDKDPIQAKLELAVINKQLRSTISEVRNVVFGLHPMTIDDLGLKASFERLFSIINEKMIFEMDMDIQEVSCENKVILLNIFRIVHECAYNILKHAEANKIVFRCYSENDKCFIYLEDNGKGFDTSIIENNNKSHFGIAMMKERIDAVDGKITFESKTGEGVKISIEVPLI